MKNKVQLIAYIDRLSGAGIPALNKLLNDETIHNFQESMKNLNSSSKKLDEYKETLESRERQTFEG